MEQKSIEIGGAQFEVDAAKLGSWRVFNMLKKVRTSEDDFGRVDLLMEIACYITGLELDAFIEKCGGDEASAEHVISLASKLIMAAYPKN